MQKTIAYLRRYFDCNISYLYSGNIHRLRIESKPKQWIYIPDSHLDDEGEDRIIEIIGAKVIPLLGNTDQKWIAVESTGVRLVTENYGKH